MTGPGLLWRFAAGERARLVLAALLGALAAACAVALMATSAWLIARAAGAPPVLYLMVAIVLVRAFGVGRGVLRYAERLIGHDAVLRVLARVRERVMAALAELAPAGLPLWRRGDLLTRLTDDIDDIGDGLLRGVLPIGTGLLVGLGTVGLLTAVLPAAGLLLALALATSCLVVPLAARRSVRRMQAAVVDARGDRSRLLGELFDQLGELTAAGLLPDRLAELDRVDARLRRGAARVARIDGVAAGLAVLTTGLAVVAAGWVGLDAVRRGGLDPVWLAVLMLTPLALADLVQAVGAGFAAVGRAAEAGGRIEAVLAAPPPGLAGPGSGAVPRTPSVIELRGVSARWPGQDRDAVHEVDLTLRPGDRLVLLGESGSGKSTLLAVLLGFLRPSAGRYLIDGVDAHEFDPEQLRRLYGWCEQQTYLFDSSVAENIRLARPAAGRADLVEALRAAGLADWWAGLPDGLDTAVGEHGSAVSGGERQRLGIARALLADRPVMLADEPAAHLDPATADAVTRLLMRPDPTRAVVLVTHREADAAWGTAVLRLSAKTRAISGSNRPDGGH